MQKQPACFSISEFRSPFCEMKTQNSEFRFQNLRKLLAVVFFLASTMLGTDVHAFRYALVIGRNDGDLHAFILVLRQLEKWGEWLAPFEHGFVDEDLFH